MQAVRFEASIPVNCTTQNLLYSQKFSEAIVSWKKIQNEYYMMKLFLFLLLRTDDSASVINPGLG